MIDAFASEPQFSHHLQPIMDLVEAGDWQAENPDRPVIVASYGDLKQVRRKGYTKIARIEHGAGQSYGTDHGNYAGGRDNEDVSLFLVPNQYSSDLWSNAYPKARVEIVGCPKLDSLPLREHFIGIQSEAWQASVADIRTHLRTLVSDQAGNRLCVAHAIADASPTAPAPGRWPVTPPKPNMIDVGISPDGLMQSLDQPGLAPLSTALVRSAISACTSSSGTPCQARATSAEQPIDLKRLFAGIRLRSTGESATPSPPTLRIPTTTFGCVSLATSSTTAKAVAREVSERPRVVAISWHWDCRLVPETMSAFGHFRRAFPALVEAFNVIGHCHPRAAINPPNLPRHYRRAGIEYVEDFAEVCRRADLYICDNSSSLYEFAATDRPVVVMNAPTYRKDVHHGLRFWDAIPGPQVDDPNQLVEIVTQTLQDGQQALRDEALALVYPNRTGAAERAAAILTEWSTA